MKFLWNHLNEKPLSLILLLLIKFQNLWKVISSMKTYLWTLVRSLLRNLNNKKLEYPFPFNRNKSNIINRQVDCLSFRHKVRIHRNSNVLLYTKLINHLLVDKSLYKQSKVRKSSQVYNRNLFLGFQNKNKQDLLLTYPMMLLQVYSHLFWKRELVKLNYYLVKLDHPDGSC